MPSASSSTPTDTAATPETVMPLTSNAAQHIQGDVHVSVWNKGDAFGN